MIKKILLRSLLSLVLVVIFGMLIDSTVENIMIYHDINEFKNKGVLQVDKSTTTEKWYKVSRETWMSDKSTYFIDSKSNKMYYGNSGDIVVGLESALRDYPIISEVTTFLFGGHASFVSYEGSYKNALGQNLEYNNRYHIESTYDDGVSRSDGDFWTDVSYRNEVIVLRVNVSEEILKSVFLELTTHVGKKYNKLYIVDTKNKYYCTDLITRAFSKFGYDLNYDGFYASVEDLIVSKLTYISFYKIYENGITSYYYIGDEND